MRVPTLPVCETRAGDDSDGRSAGYSERIAIILDETMRCYHGKDTVLSEASDKTDLDIGTIIFSNVQWITCKIGECR